MTFYICRSANVQIIDRGLFSTKYQCMDCGRTFKKKNGIYYYNHYDGEDHDDTDLY